MIHVYGMLQMCFCNTLEKRNFFTGSLRNTLYIEKNVLLLTWNMLHIFKKECHFMDITILF